MSSRVVVMYLGRVDEIGAADTLFEDAKHPYTRALFRSMLSMDPVQRTLEAPISGDPPSPIDPPPGCRFNTRCAFAEAPCRAATPHRAVVGPGHEAACHMSDPASGHSRAGVRAAAGATP